MHKYKLFEFDTDGIPIADRERSPITALAINSESVPRIGEQLTVWLGEETPNKYVVRNVDPEIRLGSGKPSALESYKSQVRVFVSKLG